MAGDPKKPPLIDVRDIVGLIGLGLVSYGAWLIYQPAAYIVCGFMLVVAAALHARRQ